MAKTYFSASSAETKQIWEEKLFRDVLKDSFMSKFMGEDQLSAIQVKTNLEKDKGDRINFGIRYRVKGKGVNQGQNLEGNEQKLDTAMDYVTLNQYRNAVRTEGKLSEQRAFFEIPLESAAAIKDWGTEAIDELCIKALTDGTPTKIIYGGDATSTADIDETDKITPALIRKVRAGAKTGYGRTQVPLKPIKTEFGNMYVLLVHPDVAYDLKENPAFEQARREALERGAKNPIFDGSLAIYDGVAIYEHENVPIVSNWGATADVAGAKCVLMGQQALCWAWGKRPRTVQRDFDYDNEIGYAWDMIAGVKRPKFTDPRTSVASDYGSIAVYVARTPIASSNDYLGVTVTVA